MSKSGKVEKWKGGRVEGWKGGKVEEWKGGKVERWKGGRVEWWKGGRVEGCNPDSRERGVFKSAEHARAHAHSPAVRLLGSYYKSQESGRTAQLAIVKQNGRNSTCVVLHFVPDSFVLGFEPRT